ncbi:MAG: CHAT domain-containing protein, partial [Myxococcota bacterium]|nr:CHAT domain-containing protein [Myxococcota bacterium]
DRLAAETAGPGARYGVLLALARAERALGEYSSAEASAEEAVRQAERLGDGPRRAAAVVALGGIRLGQGDGPAAEAQLQVGLALAREWRLPGVEAAALNDLGNLASLRGNAEEAADLHGQAAQLAQEARDPALVALALANAARALQSDPEASLARVDRAEEALSRVADSHSRAALLLNLGLGLRAAAEASPERADVLALRATELLREALAVAQAVGDARVAAHALGALGGLAEESGRVSEALRLTRRALEEARFLAAPELTYRWHAQRGRLLAATGDRDAAIAAFERAVSLLQALRDRPGWGAGLGDSSFDRSVAPVYRALLDLLLTAAEESVDPARKQHQLAQARQAMENFKAAELRDFFRDDCVDAQRARTRGLEKVSPEATIVYPILLPGRTVLLSSAPDGSLDLVSVPVTRDVVEAEAKALRGQLERQATRRFLVHAQRLYDWLIRPLESRLEASGTHTLVFVPDGALLMIPMASLHDGSQFLVEKFALATTPGFDLVDPAPMDHRALGVLLAGISKSVDGQDPLPNVAAELAVLESLLGGRVLLDDAFLRADLRESLEARNFGIIHIATHAQFSSRPDETFLQAWDGRIGLDELSEDVGLFRFREEPLELLALSACETARGDERSSLGLSGMAVKAGARSVLGSLWSVNDPAATALVEAFYRRLIAGDSRAQALRAAQLGLLEDFRYRHPAYWAPFLLIGTWL